MHSSRDDRDVLARLVIPSDESLSIELKDGRTFIVPFHAVPSLAIATPEQRRTFELIGSGTGLHWPALDEDLSTAGLFRDFGGGRPQLLHEVPLLIADLYRITQRLGEIFDGRPFTPDGHLVGSIGEVVAELIYDLVLQPPSTPQFDARTRDTQKTVQIKLTGRHGSQYGFRWTNQREQTPADLLVCLRMTSEGFEEVYAGEFPVDLLRNRADSSNGQLSITAAKLARRNPRSMPQVYSLFHFNKLFRTDLNREPLPFPSGSESGVEQNASQLLI